MPDLNALRTAKNSPSSQDLLLKLPALSYNPCFHGVSIKSSDNFSGIAESFLCFSKTFILFNKLSYPHILGLYENQNLEKA